MDNTQKHAGGRPLLFETVEELQEKIQAYFDDCKPHPEETVIFRWKKKDVQKRVRDDKTGKIVLKTVQEDDFSQRPDEETQWHISQPKIMTISSLAVFLKTSRRTLINYQEKDGEFFHTIKEAKDIIEAQWEDRLVGSNVTGVIFNLKNNYDDWHDKQEQVISNPDGTMNPYAKLSDEELKTLANG